MIALILLVFKVMAAILIAVFIIALAINLVLEAIISIGGFFDEPNQNLPEEKKEVL